MPGSVELRTWLRLTGPSQITTGVGIVGSVDEKRRWRKLEESNLGDVRHSRSRRAPDHSGHSFQRKMDESNVYLTATGFRGQRRATATASSRIGSGGRASRTAAPKGSRFSGPAALPCAFILQRREWDSNPRRAFARTRVPGGRLEPLGHLSKFTVSPIRRAGGSCTRDLLRAGGLAAGLQPDFLLCHALYPADAMYGDHTSGRSFTSILVCTGSFLGFTGSDRSVMPASCGVRLPFLLLHG